MHSEPKTSTSYRSSSKWLVIRGRRLKDTELSKQMPGWKKWGWRQKNYWNKAQSWRKGNQRSTKSSTSLQASWCGCLINSKSIRSTSWSSLASIEQKMESHFLCFRFSHSWELSDSWAKAFQCMKQANIPDHATGKKTLTARRPLITTKHLMSASIRCKRLLTGYLILDSARSKQPSFSTFW